VCREFKMKTDALQPVVQLTEHASCIPALGTAAATSVC